jgi:hypothetical protein
MAKDKYSVVSAANPYEAPDVYLNTAEGRVAVESSENVRKRYAAHESMIYVFGYMILVGGILFALASVANAVGVWIVLGRDDSGLSKNEIEAVKMIVTFVQASILGYWITVAVIGKHLLQLKKFGRMGATIFASFLILSLIGAAPAIYLLWLLWSDNGEAVFSRRYATVVSETRGMSLPIPPLAFLFIGLYVMVVGGYCFVQYLAFKSVIAA